MTDLNSTPEYAPFFRRFGAYFIDAVLLGTVGAILAYPLANWLASLTWQGRLIGELIALPYFVVMNSKVGGGASVGKRILKLKVVGRDGGLLSPLRAAGRYVALSLPFFFNGLYIPSGPYDKQIGIVIVLIVFGLGLSIVYLFFFNSTNRRNLHDIVADSAVVRLEFIGSPSNWSIPRKHWCMVALIVIASITVPIIYLKSTDTSTLSRLLPLQKAVEEDPDVQYAGVTRTTRVMSADGRKTTAETLNIVARLRSKTREPKKIADRISEKIYGYPESIVGVESISVALWWGYDIGIASSSSSSAWEYPSKRLSTSE